MKTKLKNQNGDISIYGLACGYIQKWECKNMHSGEVVEITLKQIEGGNYQTLVWYPSEHRELHRLITPKLTRAREVFARYKNYIKTGICF